MNQALNIKNWKEGGNSYILKGNPKNKWVGFQETVINQLKASFRDNFNLVIWTDRNDEKDFYCIPFSSVQHLFTEKHKTTGKYDNRWTAVIQDHRFLMHSNRNYSVDVSNFYGIEVVPKNPIVIDDDFFIENATAEINIRIGQSKFRKGVLENFNNKCAITGVSEPSLLRASHIIPWSHRKDCRGDIANGIALYVEVDALFDKGYISFTDDYQLVVTNRLDELSEKLKIRIEKLRGSKLRRPKLGLRKDYLSYHRENIFIK